MLLNSAEQNTESSVQETHSANVRRSRRTGKELINQFEILRELGEGSFGKVVLCRDVNQQYSRLAMKIIRKFSSKKSSSENKAYLDDIRREVAIMKRLDHPNIVHLYEVIDDPNSDKMYLVMEYLPGGPVLNKDSSSLSEHRCRIYMRDIVMGLEYCHDNGIIHHDLKPENILIGQDGHLRICDFGVSIICRNDDKETVLRGTPPFLAPEVIIRSQTKQPFAGKPVDIWALGITLYMMVFNRAPFKGHQIQETFKLIVHQKLSFPFRLSNELTDFLNKILDKNPDTRINMDEIKVHPWLTNFGQEPFPAKLKGIEITQKELDDAFTSILPLRMVIDVKRRLHKHLLDARDKISRNENRSEQSVTNDTTDNSELNDDQIMDEIISDRSQRDPNLDDQIENNENDWKGGRQNINSSFIRDDKQDPLSSAHNKEINNMQSEIQQANLFNVPQSNLQQQRPDFPNVF
ncbi:MAG: putative Calcium/calmodulin-dependent protein kinase kinase 2 [Streblomastix strix]|uniref:non-specific serine/threonine protein kinase n=1 Tax=Streblomastix strix TaxID=222440 RepID=A0A5J4X3N9_9EUKA|nr:MAG: putative Calcium/calmodulin-dependent protein kinase kinase 2 [Streblomastix strix]